MRHPDEGTIHAWLDGALPPAEASALEAHVASCAECSAAVAEARGMLAAASRILSTLDDVSGGVIPAAAPADATRVAARRGSAAEVRPFRFRAARWQVAAGLMIAVAGSWLVMRNEGARDMVEIEAADTSMAADASVAMAQPDTLSGAQERVAEVALPATPVAPRAGRPGSRTEVASSAPTRSAFGTDSGGKGGVAGAAGTSTGALIGDVSGVLRGVDVSRGTGAANKVASEAALAQVQATAAAQSPLDSALAADSVATARMAMRLEAFTIQERTRAIEPAQRRQIAPAPAAPPVASRGAAADAAPELAQSGIPEAVRRTAGCYVISLGRWIGQVDSASSAVVPKRLQLASEPVPGTPNAASFVARAVPGDPAFASATSVSWTLGADQLRVRFGTADHLAVMTLAISPEVLRGRVRVTAGEAATAVAELTARRFACPAPPAER